MFSKGQRGCLVTKYSVNPLWRSKLSSAKVQFFSQLQLEKSKNFTFSWSINCYGSVWASGGAAVGFSQCCSLTDSTVFFLSWSLIVFSPYPTQTFTFSSPKGAYTFFADSGWLYRCSLLLSSLLFHCLATRWWSFPLTTLPEYPFLLWNSFSSHIHVVFPIGYSEVDCNSIFIWNRLFSNVFATIPIDLGRLFSCTPQQLSVSLLGTRTLCRFSSKWHSGGHRNALRQVGSLREMWAK